MLPVSKRHFLVFGLITLVVITLYTVIASYSQPQSIQWKTYSTQEIKTDLQNNKIVLISVMASWSHDTIFHEYAFIRQPPVENIILSKKFSCYRVDLAKIPGHQGDAWRDFFDDLSGLGMILAKKDYNNHLITRTTLYNKMSIKKVLFEIESISNKFK